MGRVKSIDDFIYEDNLTEENMPIVVSRYSKLMADIIYDTVYEAAGDRGVDMALQILESREIK